MTPKKLFYTMVAALGLLIILIVGGVVYGNTLLKTKAQKLTELKAQNKSIEEQQVALIQAKKDVEKYSPLNDITKTIVPQDKDQAKTVREINQIAVQNNIDLVEVTFNTSTLGQAQPAAPKPEGGGAAATPATPAAPSITQVKPVDGIKGVFSLEATIRNRNQISYGQFINFLEDLEQNRRTSHVSKITINPSKTDDTLLFVLTLNAYVKP